MKLDLKVNEMFISKNKQILLSSKLNVYLDVSNTERTCFNHPDDSSELKNPLMVNDFWSIEMADYDEA